MKIILIRKSFIASLRLFIFSLIIKGLGIDYETEQKVECKMKIHASSFHKSKVRMTVNFERQIIFFY